MLRVARWRKTGIAGANYGEWFADREMGEGFFEGAGEICERGTGNNSNYGFAETEDAVGSGFEGLAGGIV